MRVVQGSATVIEIPTYTMLVETRNLAAVPKTILVFDPGDRYVGLAVFVDGYPDQCGQLRGTHEELIRQCEATIDKVQPDHIVVESYRLYERKADVQINSSFPTSRLIGALELICMQRDIEYTMQSAAQAKAFVTEVKLKAWGIFQIGKPHANDALRHGTTFILFDKRFNK